MVTGSRTFGVCEHPPGSHVSGLCPVRELHKQIMIMAFVEHVKPMEFPVELIHGDAEGADRLAAALWSRFGLGPITAFPANWDLGKGGGAARNGVLVAHMPDLVLAFHLDNSRGTADAIRQAKAAGLTVEVYPR
jgi:hypothetical protein